MRKGTLGSLLPAALIVGVLTLVWAFGPATPATIGAQLTVASGQAVALGDTTLATPAAGKRLRIFALHYGTALGVTAGLRCAAGTVFFKQPLGVNTSFTLALIPYFLECGVDEALRLNLGAGVATEWTVLYVEV